MIKRGTAGRALSWPMFGAVCTMGGLLLPLAPGFGQVANTTETLASSSAPQSNGNAGSVSVATSSAAETTPTATATVAVVPDAATNEVSVTSVEAVPTTPAPEVGTVTRAAGEEPRDVRDARREVERLRAQLARAQDRLARLEGRASNRAPIGIGSGLPDGTTAASQYGRAAGARASAGRGAQEQAALSRLGQAAGDNQQQRLDALEGQVREILNELRQMKREQRNNNENQAK